MIENEYCWARFSREKQDLWGFIEFALSSATYGLFDLECIAVPKPVFNAYTLHQAFRSSASTILNVYSGTYTPDFVIREICLSSVQGKFEDQDALLS